MKILFLIVARQGSKGVPNKNIRELCGIPLFAFKAISALKSDYCSRLIMSTDSEVIGNLAKKYNVEVPFIRPDYLATDTASSIDVVLHAMDWIEVHDNQRYDALALLEPSSPFLTYFDINNAVRLYEEKHAISILGVKETEVSTSFIAEIGEDLSMKKHYEKVLALSKLRRQDFNKEYTMNGAIYLCDWEYLKKKKSFHSEKTYAYIMPSERSIEIDNIQDYNYASYLITSNIIDIRFWNSED
mgnify:FL=1